MPEFTEGVMADGFSSASVVLRDGQPLPISEVVAMLNGAAALKVLAERNQWLYDYEVKEALQPLG